MFRIKTLNHISGSCGDFLAENNCVIGDDIENPDAIFVRATDINNYDFNENLLCVTRAGIGVNNIPLERCAEKGIVAFNTPGGNANGVKELFLFGITMACRDLQGAMKWVQEFDCSSADISSVMEKIKNRFVGPDYMGKKLGVIGLGNVGSKIANISLHLGMKVYGYDPFLSVDAAWKVSREVKHVSSIDEICQKCDFITIHVPLKDDTHGMINSELIAKMKDGVKIINYARKEVVDEPSMIHALDSGKVSRFVTDFPSEPLIGRNNVIITPHLGGTTYESEDNCALMAARQAVDYLKNGNIVNSVNMGRAVLAPSCNPRLCVFHKNAPNMIAQITAGVSTAGINIENMVNSSKKGFSVAYTMLELSSVSDDLLSKICGITDVIRARIIPAKSI